MITGAAGSGKSRLSYELIQQGGQLIADDVVILQQQKNLIAFAPDELAGLIHLRDEGFINLAKKQPQSVNLCAHTPELWFALDDRLNSPNHKSQLLQTLRGKKVDLSSIKSNRRAKCVLQFMQEYQKHRIH